MDGAGGAGRAAMGALARGAAGRPALRGATGSGAPRAAAWLAVLAVFLGAWVILHLSAGMSGVDWIGRPVGPNLMPMESLGALLPMWGVMMAAMMLPAMVPALAAYEALIRSAEGTRAGWLGLLAGYLGAWLAFAALIAAAQVALLRIEAVDALGAARSPWLAAALLAAVGLYQFTPAKRGCQGACPSPRAYLLGRWQPGARGGLRMGWGLGGLCVGSCWGFMALGFVGGVMSLLWMGAATGLMLAEKLGPAGRRMRRPLGVALVAAAGLVASRAAGLA